MDQRFFCSEQTVEQRGFPTVGKSDNHNVEHLAHKISVSDEFILTQREIISAR